MIDCPGQVELYTHNHSVRNILNHLEEHGARLCAGCSMISEPYSLKYFPLCYNSLQIFLWWLRMKLVSLGLEYFTFQNTLYFKKFL